MLPVSEIRIDDMFSNPLHRGLGRMSGLEFRVIEKKEGLIKLQGYRYLSAICMGAPFWKKPTDRMFCEAWRVSK